MITQKLRIVEHQTKIEGVNTLERWRAELCHHGIKGMRWGVRRTPEQLGHEPPTKASKRAKAIAIVRIIDSSRTKQTNGERLWKSHFLELPEWCQAICPNP